MRPLRGHLIRNKPLLLVIYLKKNIILILEPFIVDIHAIESIRAMSSPPASPPSSSGAPPIQVELSQDELYFIVPYGTTVVENILEVRNKMPTTSASTPVLTYKTLSTVQGRYGLSDPVGTIPPGGSATIRVTLEPKSAASSSPPLPALGGTDTLYLDIAIVPEGTTLRDGKDAASFWRQRGPVRLQAGGTRSAAGSGLRVRVPCRFLSKEELPPHLKLRHVPLPSPQSVMVKGTRGTKSQQHVQVRTPQEMEEDERRQQQRRGGAGDGGLYGVGDDDEDEDDVQQQSGPIWKRALSFRFSYQVAAFFVIIAFLCGWIDRAAQER